MGTEAGAVVWRDLLRGWLAVGPGRGSFSFGGGRVPGADAVALEATESCFDALRPVTR